MYRFFVLFFIGCFFIMANGCGYSKGSLLSPNLKTIYVDNFRNEIDVGGEITEFSKYALYRPGLENDLTNAVVDRFTFDGNLKIVNKESADLVLKGALSSYIKEALRYDNADNVEEYRIRITVNMELIRTSEDKVMWREANFAGESTYKTKGGFAVSEELARENALEDLARRIVERTIEGW